MLLVGVLLGFGLALVVLVPLIVWLDRRDEARRRVQLRVDATPAPMPGAFEPWAGRSLVAAHRGVVIEQDDREDAAP